MRNLKELASELKQRCDQLGLDYQCGPDGTFFSQFAIVGEAPGPTEVEQRLPLVGGSGALLWRVLNRRCNLSRKDFYITNVSKRQVMLTTEKRKAINKHELDLWTDMVLWELGHLPNLKYILVLGGMALEALSGKSGIADWRGSVLDILVADHSSGTKRPVRLVCCNNPAFVIREPRMEIVFSFDINRFNEVIHGRHHPVAISTELYPTSKRIDEYLTDCERSGDIVSTDIETIGGQTACIGFANSTTNAMCVAFRTKSDHVYSADEERHIRRRIQSFYKSSARITAQKGMFDATWLWFFDRIHIPTFFFDTMLAHHLLYPPLPHNLGFITSMYTHNPYYKNERSEWKEGGNIDEFWDYNGKDCCNTLAATFGMMKELKEAGLEDFYHNHVMKLLNHLVLMTVGGVLIDVQMKDKLREELHAKVGKLLNEFQKLANEAVGELMFFNPNSPKQMSDLYFNRLKLVGRGVKTDEENRDRMFKHPRTSDIARQVLVAQNAYMKENKFFGTYVKTGIDEDNRMRCEYSQTNVQEAPGRLSSSQTLWGSGGNLQNQPSRAYPMFIADDGYVFIYFDLSQAEARYVGWDAKIESWIEQFERARLDPGSYDAHCALAADMFHIPYHEVPSFDHYDTAKGRLPPTGKRDGDFTVRYIAKRCRHGLNYRMGPDTLAIKTGLPIREAEKSYRLYHKLTPELRRWWQRLEHDLTHEGALFNSYGRRFILMERKSDEALESIVAFRPQSTIGDKVSRVIYLCHEDDRWPSHARVALNNHDALIGIARKDQAKTALSIMVRHAEEPLYIHGRELIIPAEPGISEPDEHGIHRWSTIKKLDRRELQ